MRVFGKGEEGGGGRRSELQSAVDPSSTKGCQPAASHSRLACVADGTYPSGSLREDFEAPTMTSRRLMLARLGLRGRQKSRKARGQEPRSASSFPSAQTTVQVFTDHCDAGGETFRYVWILRRRGDSPAQKSASQGQQPGPLSAHGDYVGSGAGGSATMAGTYRLFQQLAPFFLALLVVSASDGRRRTGHSVGFVLWASASSADGRPRPGQPRPRSRWWRHQLVPVQRRELLGTVLGSPVGRG